jgi:hypothetical protein
VPAAYPLVTLKARACSTRQLDQIRKGLSQAFQLRGERFYKQPGLGRSMSSAMPPQDFVSIVLGLKGATAPAPIT